MRCEEAKVLMTRERSEALAPEQITLLDAHTAGCSTCRKDREELAGVAAALMAARPQAVYASRPDTAVILSRSQRELMRENTSWRGLALGAVALGAAALAIVFLAKKMPSEGVKDVQVAREVPRNIATFTTKITKDGKKERLPFRQQADQQKIAGNGSAGVRRLANFPTGEPRIRPIKDKPQPAGDELNYLNAPGNSGGPGLRWPSQEIEEKVARLEKSVKAGDDFVAIPGLQVAAVGDQSSQAAAQAYAKEKAIVDARLVRKVTLAVKGASFADLCRQLMKESGVQITANRKVAEDKVTVFCKERPLRDIMRQITSLFGFTWVRSGKEGEFEYELTQTLKSELIEEALREKDRNEMLLALDRQMEKFRPFLGLSLAQIKELASKRLSAGIKEKTAFDEYNTLNMLERGGLYATNMFFRLTPRELDALRNGDKLNWNLSTRQLGLPHAVWDGIDATFKDMVSGSPKEILSLSATLELDKSRQGEYVLKGGLYNQEGGMSATLAHATSPAKDKKRIENAVENAALAKEPTLQQKVTLTVEPSCTLARPPYPDTDFAYAESAGPKALTYDVLEAIHQKSGRDIIGDQFMRLHDPSKVSGSGHNLFEALNHAGDAMQIRWTKEEGWLKFRSPDYYYARPQEVPTHLFEHWAEVRKKGGVLGVDELGEIAQLTDAQLDSISSAQGAVAVYGLEEWPVARQDQGRPHWRFLGKLSRQQRDAAVSDKGLAFMALSAALKRDYVKLSDCADTGLYLTEADMRDAHLRVLYSPLADSANADSPASRLLPRNAAVFLYSFGNPKRYSAIGPFNAIVGLSEPMLEQHMKRGSAEN